MPRLPPVTSTVRVTFRSRHSSSASPSPRRAAAPSRACRAPPCSGARPSMNASVVHRPRQAQRRREQVAHVQLVAEAVAALHVEPQHSRHADHPTQQRRRARSSRGRAGSTASRWKYSAVGADRVGRDEAEARSATATRARTRAARGTASHQHPGDAREQEHAQMPAEVGLAREGLRQQRPAPHQIADAHPVASSMPPSARPRLSGSVSS